ncbi:unnamed protein product [Strongylus vulgaris]|uniref:Endonuclease/exonuclease/phosphatase domain-containing protein n=1 Tax=Strongylus vulgaris TaxID=40348 RepID=A0A3P7KIP3_STRVU|nr:unnamed protein product [Strongylus vulgaris]
MKKEHRRAWEPLNGTNHAEIDYILTNRRLSLLDVSLVPSFSNGSEHRLLRAKVRFSRKLEKKICHHFGGEREVVYDGVLEELLTTCDWPIEEDPTKDCDLLPRG